MKLDTVVTYENVMQILKVSWVHDKVRSKVAKLLLSHAGNSMTIGEMRDSYISRKKSDKLRTTWGMKAWPKVKTDAEAVIDFLIALKPGKPEKWKKKK